MKSQQGLPSWRILIMADSLGLPRPAMPFYDSHAVTYDKTYPHLLSLNLKKLEQMGQFQFEMIVNAERARTMPKTADYWIGEGSLFSPKIVVVHIGIVDCAPRVFTPMEHYLVSKIRPIEFQKKILDFVSKNRRKRILARPKVYTTLNNFEVAATRIVQSCSQADIKLGFVSIAPTNDLLAYRSPGIVENIIHYNQVLQKVAHEWNASYIDLHSALSGHLPDEYLLGDGHHLDFKGHVILTELLSEWVKATVLSHERENE